MLYWLNKTKGATGMARTTDKREAILRFITDFMRNQGYPPRCARSVRRRPCLNGDGPLPSERPQGRRPHPYGRQKNRTISLPEERRSGSIPIVGVVTAGQPILAVENIEGYLPWDGDERCFALRVRGDSMIGAGILSGDKVVVRPQLTAENGQIVVALLDDSATVKRFRREKGKVWLLPENPRV